VLRRNVFQQGSQSDNNEVIGLSLEPKRGLASRHSVVMEDNWIIFDPANQGKKVLFRGQALGPISLHNNIFVGMSGLGIDTAKEEGSHWFDAREQAGLRRFDGSLESLPIPGIPAVTGGDSQKRGASWRLF
jgi:hypothetical protein